MAIQFPTTYKGLPVPAAAAWIEAYHVASELRETIETIREPNPGYVEGAPFTPYTESQRTVRRKVYIVTMEVRTYTDATREWPLESLRYVVETTVQADITFTWMYRYLSSLPEFSGAIEI